MTIDQIIDAIIVRESREYSNRPADRGGPTKFGITLATLSAWRKRACTEDDVMNLAEDEARAIYRDIFVVQPGYLQITDDIVRAFVVDAAVQHGAAAATKQLQAAAHVFVDGQLGPKTAAAVNRMTPKALFLRVFAQRTRYYGAIIAHDAQLQAAKAAGFDRLEAFNALGWADRMATQLEESI